MEYVIANSFYNNIVLCMSYLKHAAQAICSMWDFAFSSFVDSFLTPLCSWRGISFSEEWERDMRTLCQYTVLQGRGLVLLLYDVPYQTPQQKAQ